MAMALRRDVVGGVDEDVEAKRRESEMPLAAAGLCRVVNGRRPVDRELRAREYGAAMVSSDFWAEPALNGSKRANERGVLVLVVRDGGVGEFR